MLVMSICCYFPSSVKYNHSLCYIILHCYCLCMFVLGNCRRLSSVHQWRMFLNNLNVSFSVVFCELILLPYFKDVAICGCRCRRLLVHLLRFSVLIKCYLICLCKIVFYVSSGFHFDVWLFIWPKFRMVWHSHTSLPTLSWNAGR